MVEARRPEKRLWQYLGDRSWRLRLWAVAMKVVTSDSRNIF